MKDPLLKIKNISKFSKFLLYNTIEESGMEIKKKDIKHYITTKNLHEIVLLRVKKDKRGDLLVNNKIYKLLQNDILDWVLGVSLAKMAANDEIDCYWDSTKDCMMFSFKKGNKNGKKNI
jgi:hypothetical protein